MDMAACRSSKLAIELPADFHLAVVLDKSGQADRLIGGVLGNRAGNKSVVIDEEFHEALILNGTKDVEEPLEPRPVAIERARATRARAAASGADERCNAQEECKQEVFVTHGLI